MYLVVCTYVFVGYQESDDWSEVAKITPTKAHLARSTFMTDLLQRVSRGSNDYDDWFPMLSVYLSLYIDLC